MTTQAELNPSARRHILPQEEACRSSLNDAAAHLERSARLLAGPEPDCMEALTSTLRTIRQSYTALLEWHSLPPREDAPLGELAGPAERLASMLRTCLDRALPLEPLVASLRNGAETSVAVREAAMTSYYTARNTLLTVLSELPEPVGRGAMAQVDRAESLRVAKAARSAATHSESPVVRRPAGARAHAALNRDWVAKLAMS